MKYFFKNYRRVVLKIGSSLVITKDSKPNHTWLESLAADVAELKECGIEVAIVTSGAVALGAHYIGKSRKSMKLQEKQAAAACGQLALVKAYQENFQHHNMHVAQILLTLEDSENRRRYLNARATLETLLELGIIPVINENDTVATAELKFGDNDRLAARVAQMIGAEVLILLSDIDGLYTADPRKSKTARHIPEIQGISPEIEAMAKDSTSDTGSGGMVTKIQAAKIADAFGSHTIITLGMVANPIKKLAAGAKHTIFVSNQDVKTARKNWIAENLNAKGEVAIDDGALAALKKGKSLLPAGVTAVKGSFARGDTVRIKTAEGKEIGRGLIAYPAAEAKAIIGHKSAEIEEILGFAGREELIHRDDMVLSKL